MFGCCKLAAAAASARNRCTISGLASGPNKQHLHRDHPVQAHLPRLVHDAHPAARDFLQQLVIAERAREQIFDSRFWICELRWVERHLRLSSGRQSSFQQAARTKLFIAEAGQWRPAFSANMSGCHKQLAVSSNSFYDETWPRLRENAGSRLRGVSLE